MEKEGKGKSAREEKRARKDGQAAPFNPSTGVVYGDDPWGSLGASLAYLACPRPMRDSLSQNNKADVLRKDT